MEKLRETIILSPWRTQERFSEASGIHESLISKYCRGLRQPSKRHLEIIRQMLLKKDNGQEDI